ncbi:hypothetical protein [Chitiniphilus eburneus]|uniref:hypothetical protein n=1 Tax=Chitiniphilus eburneus TaxID=2571148 RepID=UPI0035CFD529
MSNLTHGQLDYGVEYPADSGQWHYAWTVRLPTLDDNIRVLETHGAESNLAINVAMLARCLALDGIPAEAMTGELLRHGLDPADYDQLMEAQDALRKKRKRPSAS